MPSLLRQLTHPPTHRTTHHPNTGGHRHHRPHRQGPHQDAARHQGNERVVSLVSSPHVSFASPASPIPTRSLAHSLTTTPQSPQGFSEAKVEKIKTIARKLCGGASGMSIFSTGVEVCTCMCWSAGPSSSPPTHPLQPTHKHTTPHRSASAASSACTSPRAPRPSTPCSGAASRRAPSLRCAVCLVRSLTDPSQQQSTTAPHHHLTTSPPHHDTQQHRCTGSSARARPSSATRSP